MASRLSNNANSYARNPAQEQAAAQARARAQAKSQIKVAQARQPAGPPKGIPLATQQAAAPTPMPWDAAYEESVDSINQGRTDDLASIDNQIAAAKQSYGFDDTTDPFSKIAMFKEAFANQKRGIDTNAAASGQLFSGSRANDQTTAQHQNDVGYDALRRDYDSVLNGLADRRSGINHTADDAIASAGLTRVQNAVATSPDPSTVPPATMNAPGFKAQAGTDSKGNAGTWHIYPDGHRVFVAKGK